jgi:ABC-type multidrug transport system fused ATPase/permease subunit
VDKEKSLSFFEKLAFVWSYLGNHKKQVFIYMMLTLLTSLMNSIYPYLTGKILDVATGKATFYSLNWQTLVGLMAFIMISGMALKESMDFFIQKMGLKLSAKINLDLLKHIYQLRASSTESKSSGELLKVLDRLLDAIMRITEMIIYNFLPQTITLVVALVVITSYSCVLGLALFVSVILFFFFSICYKMPAILKMQKKINEGFNEQFGNIADSVNNLATVKSMVTADYELAVKKNKWQDLIRQALDQSRLYINYGVAQSTINIAMRLVTISWTIYFFQQQKITFGELVTIITYINWAMAPLFMLANNIRDFRRKLVDLEDAAKIKQQEIETDTPGAEPHAIQGRITFDRVSFAYPGRDHLTLKNISFDLEPGQTLAIVGQTGSGKSTIGKLLKRMYALKSGETLFDRIDINNITLESLRRQISIVEQNPELFTGTIRDNIAYGREDATFEEIRDAARVAQLDEEIMSDAFPDHYDTKIGGKGSALSGGQIQRIAIARAIINKPKVLVLDEATNSLDLLTKHKILDSLQVYISGLTTLIISHDLSAMVRKADQIIVMHDGQIVQQGKHENLITREGVYRQYWEIQKTI